MSIELRKDSKYALIVPTSMVCADYSFIWSACIQQ